MKLYILYLITSLLIAWIILLMLGVSAGFASNLPIAALIGSLLLFSIATPVLIYNNRFGLVIALVSLLMIIPYTIGFAKSILYDGVFNWVVLLAILPIILTLLCTFLTIKYLFVRTGVNLKLPTSSGRRMLLASLPVSLTILYFIFYGKVWF